MEINIDPLKISRNYPYSPEVAEKNKKELERYRKELGEKITSLALLNPTYLTTFSSTFSGYGDSGQYDYTSGNFEVDDLFAYMVDTVVNFDWYNNEGGGGDITWDVISDTITINGYQNVTSQVSMMEEEKF